MIRLAPDFKEFLRLLNSNGIETGTQRLCLDPLGTSTTWKTSRESRQTGLSPLSFIHSMNLRIDCSYPRSVGS